jgi:hypothetical protein
MDPAAEGGDSCRMQLANGTNLHWHPNERPTWRNAGIGLFLNVNTSAHPARRRLPPSCGTQLLRPVQRV